MTFRLSHWLALGLCSDSWLHGPQCCGFICGLVRRPRHWSQMCQHWPMVAVLGRAPIAVACALARRAPSHGQKAVIFLLYVWWRSCAVVEWSVGMRLRRCCVASLGLTMARSAGGRNVAGVSSRSRITVVGLLMVSGACFSAFADSKALASGLWSYRSLWVLIWGAMVALALSWSVLSLLACILSH